MTRNGFIYVDLKVSQCPDDGAVRIEVHGGYDVKEILREVCGYKYCKYGKFWWRRFAGKSTLKELKVRHHPISLLLGRRRVRNDLYHAIRANNRSA